ncbi:efflux RND transporter periplasmic adaptor subunit [Pedobacter sp. P351]|uniref:efflux RND transporter periplasmic adaptor subunit n=1 Tax=Pedobacter superstes TaxID=3133441 RepID=UPI003097F8B0
MILKGINTSVVILASIITVMLYGCKNQSADHSTDHQATKVGPKYTCPMHPQIVQDHPGNCPICGMELVVMKNTGAENSLMLSKSQMQLANISTVKVGSGNFKTSTILTGRLVTNPLETEVISSRMAGRIERLFVKETGIRVVQGEPLFQIYSEQLQVLQQDYLLQIKQVAAFPGEKIYQSLKEAARNKLKLFGYSDSQINSLAKRNQVSPTVTIYASASGIVNEINVSEGQYISEGSPVVRLENFSRLWLEVDVYPSEVKQVAIGSVLKVIINGFSDLSQNVKVDFISPALNPSTQRLIIRAVIDNSSGKYQPGMQADVFIATGKVSGAVSLPLEAVLRDENGSYVWVKTKGNTFTSRKVITGAEDADKIVITSGISGGEEIVTSGAYLLHSEFVLKRGTTL